MVGPPSSQVSHLEGLIWPIKASGFREMNSSSDLPDSSTLPESLRLLPLLWSLNAALERTSLEMDAKLGVTGPQRLSLEICRIGARHHSCPTCQHHFA